MMSQAKAIWQQLNDLQRDPAAYQKFVAGVLDQARDEGFSAEELASGKLDRAGSDSKQVDSSLKAGYMITPDREICFEAYAVIAKGLAQDSRHKRDKSAINAVASRSSAGGEKATTTPAVQAGLSIRSRIHKLFINLVSSPAVSPPTVPSVSGSSGHRVAVETSEEKERYRRARTGDREAALAARALPNERRWNVRRGALEDLLRGTMDIPLSVGTVRDLGGDSGSSTSRGSGGHGGIPGQDAASVHGLAIDILVHPWIGKCARDAAASHSAAAESSSRLPSSSTSTRGSGPVFLDQLALLCAEAAAETHGWKLATAGDSICHALAAVEEWEGGAGSG